MGTHEEKKGKEMGREGGEREVDERMARVEGRKQEDKEERADWIGGGEKRQVEWRSGQRAGRVKETRGGGAGGSAGFLSGVTSRSAGAAGPEHAAAVPGQKTSGVDAALCPEHEDVGLLETETGTGRQDEHKLPGFKLNFQPVIGRSV